MGYEYKVVPAPTKGTKAKGVKTVEGRFALTVEGALNDHAAEGWEYVRAELLPSEERQGLTGSSTTWRTLLIFRRPTAADETEAFRPRLLEFSERAGEAAEAPEGRREPPLAADPPPGRS